ncbi:flavin-containing monooxygenase [Variovorax terrae]|uniref:NAD(P)/FAD-dependent oxidoreductase n=1 Tax=Variovorax terrae TaxID=2923278 RepID=A0A9X1VYA1_9BURK|nr:NAD(P)/FAD-dependent oxidoreductase [Variovorax terrae]MCJ0765114.1 NAD(P)/FAD-dependent oxidoreductase [Variovorax terrae]
MNTSSNSLPADGAHRVVIVGAGFAGIGLGVLLKQAGVNDFVILERADDIGGVWRDNHYPGSACDIPAVLYSYSFEVEYPWSSGYPKQRELLDYIRHVVAKYGIGPHLRFGQQVTEAVFDDNRQRWVVSSQQGQAWEGECFVPAVGIFNDPVIPRLAGQADFRGEAFHSAQWRDGTDATGMRVAVIGTGASAVQIVPEMARIAAQVSLYQRTPPFVVPKSVIAPGQPLSERERIFSEFEAVAGRRKDFAATQAAQDAFMQYLAQQVPDPALRAKLTPGFTLGCKRSLFSNEWYRVLQQPNVEVITEEIETLTKTGICTRNGRVTEVDLVVYATGFNPSNYLPGITVRGRAGALLAEAWRDGPEAYLGITVHGFPNMFILFGPNTNVPGSVLFMLECQAQYVMDALRRLVSSGARTMEVRYDTMRRFCDGLQQDLRATTQSATHCTSYYMNAAGKVVTNFPGTQTQYRQMTRAVAPDDYLLR